MDIIEEDDIVLLVGNDKNFNKLFTDLVRSSEFIPKNRVAISFIVANAVVLILSFTVYQYFNVLNKEIKEITFTLIELLNLLMIFVCQQLMS